MTASLRVQRKKCAQLYNIHPKLTTFDTYTSIVRNGSELRGGGATPLLSKKRGNPPTLSSEALFSKKNHQKCPKKGKNCEKSQKQVKRAKNRPKRVV
jgi:hypothetical protein